MDGELGHEEPIRHSLPVPPELDSFDQRLFAREDEIVVIHIGLGHAVWIEIKISPPENLRLILHFIALPQSLAGEHECAVLVFGKEIDAWDVIEQTVKHGLRC